MKILFVVLGVVVLLSGCTTSEDEQNAEIREDMKRRGISPSTKPSRPRLDETLNTSLQKDFLGLLGAQRKVVHKALGAPSEDRYTEGWDDFVIGDVKMSLRYQNGRLLTIWLNTKKRVAFGALKKWAGFPSQEVVTDSNGAEWRFSGRELSDDTTQFFFAFSDALPNWRPNLKKLLGRNAKQIEKELKGFKDYGSLYSSVENTVDVSINFDKNDGKAQSLSLDLGEGVDAKRQQAALKEWASLKTNEEQRFNGVIYKLEYTGHGIFFQRRYGRYTEKELDEVMRKRNH